jgi:hypothetical protein
VTLVRPELLLDRERDRRADGSLNLGALQERLGLAHDASRAAFGKLAQAQLLLGKGPITGIRRAVTLCMTTQLKPAKPIRRFDVFAEYRKLDAEDEGMPSDEAKGYGLWVAKVVAARKFGRQSSEEQSAGQPSKRGRWHLLSGEPQTDERFDHEVVKRMGSEFYTHVFAPAVRKARLDGDTYEAMRDRIRRRWKPPKTSAGQSTA